VRFVDDDRAAAAAHTVVTYACVDVAQFGDAELICAVVFVDRGIIGDAARDDARKRSLSGARRAANPDCAAADACRDHAPRDCDGFGLA
jgi:hypothetical protein